MADTCDWCDGAGCDACSGGVGGDTAPAESPAAGFEPCAWCDGEGCDSCDHKGFTEGEAAGGGGDWDELQEGFGETPAADDEFAAENGLSSSGAAPLGSPAASGASIAAFCNSYYSSEYSPDSDRLPLLRTLLSSPVVETIIAGGAAQNPDAFPLLLQATAARAALEARAGESWDLVSAAWASLARVLPLMDSLSARAAVTGFLAASSASTAAAKTAAAAPAAVEATVAVLPALWPLYFDLRAQAAEKAVLAEEADAHGAGRGGDSGGGSAAAAVAATADGSASKGVSKGRARASELIAELKRMCVSVPAGSGNTYSGTSSTDKVSGTTSLSAAPAPVFAPVSGSTPVTSIALDSPAAVSSALAHGRGGEYLRALSLDARLCLLSSDTPRLRKLYLLSRGPLAAALSSRSVAAALGEVWGRMHADEAAWPAAYSSFYDAFLAARDAGDMDASRRCLVYATLVSVMLPQSISPLSSRDARALTDSPGPLLAAVGGLRRAFDAGDLAEFRAAQEHVIHAAAAVGDRWLHALAVGAAATLLLKSLAARAQGPSAVISFSLFAAEAGVAEQEVASMALRLVMDGVVQGWIDEEAGTLHVAPLVDDAQAAWYSAESAEARATRGHALAAAGAAEAAVAAAAGEVVLALVAPEAGAVALQVMMRQGLYQWRTT